MLKDSLYLDLTELSGKLFCTFASKALLDTTLDEIQRKYTVMYNKIFILESPETNEYVCTYNIDPTNLSDRVLIPGTILCHRVKAHNVLYTLNALNMLILQLNGGVADHSFPIDWQEFRNSILLTRAKDFVQIHTKISQILNLC